MLRLLARTMSTGSPKGAIVTNSSNSAEIGAAILEKGGSVVDAGIAALLAEGISLPNTMGLGGGFIANIYIKDNNVVETLDAREVAPANASEDMFSGNSGLSSRGGLSVAVPGELSGYWELYNRYGKKVPWEDLVQPATDLCAKGVQVTEYLEGTLASNEELLKNDESLKECFINASSNKPLVLNECIRRPHLTETLQLVATYGADALYNGILTESFVQDIQDNCGIITLEDMKNYKPLWRKPIELSLPCQHTLYSSSPPGCGAILGLILNTLNNFLDFSCFPTVTNTHRIVESFKFAFGRRTELGDPAFEDISELLAELTSAGYAQSLRERISDDQTCPNPDFYGASDEQTGHGTANICILACNGDAFVATSTINLDFGAGFMSKSTGIILNNEMDDFSSPALDNRYQLPSSTANCVKPNKRPLSSMCPSIILDHNHSVRMLVGAAGGPKIITSIALVMMKNLWYRMPIGKALADKRFHHQLLPMLIEFEESYKNDLDLVQALYKLGHDFKISPDTGFSAVTAITQCNGTVNAGFDPRRGGGLVFLY